MPSTAYFPAVPSGLLDPRLILAVFLLFCRIGGCILVAPGFSSSQVPVQLRLFIAIGVTLALSPQIIVQSAMSALGGDFILAAHAIITETLVGVFIGLVGRLFYSGLEAIAVAVAAAIGLSNPFGVEVEPNLALSPFAALITMSATALMFYSDLHWEVLRGLTESYGAIPIGSEFNPQFALRRLVDVLGQSFRISLQVCSPFFLYSLVVNFGLSLINRLTPQIAIYFVSTPFVIIGGLLALYFTVKPMLGKFEFDLGARLISG